MDTAGDERRAQYACDVTYGTNNEFGFDYLRDNMKTSLAQMVQGELQYAIIDEVDSILVDEARTPLIISGPAHDDVSIYSKADRVARQLLSLQSSYASLEKQIAAAERQAANARGELDEAKKAKDGKRAEKAQQAIAKAEERSALRRGRQAGAADSPADGGGQVVSRVRESRSGVARSGQAEPAGPRGVSEGEGLRGARRQSGDRR